MDDQTKSNSISVEEILVLLRFTKKAKLNMDDSQLRTIVISQVEAKIQNSSIEQKQEQEESK